MKISSIYSNGMILQRESENLIRGSFEESEVLSFLFDGQEMTVNYDKDNLLWSVSLPEMPAGGPHTISVSVNGNKEEITDILFGDVYVLGGQSNMELPLIWTTDFHYDEIRSADFSEIRQFEVPKIPLFGKKENILNGGCWVNADQKHIDNFSAIGFYFAKEKYLKDHIPVGLVQTAVGGAPVESLMSEENLRESFSRIKPDYIHSGECNKDKSKGCLWCYEEKLEKYSNMDYVQSVATEDLKRQEAWHKNVDDHDPGLSSGWKNKWPAGQYESFVMPSTFYQTAHESFKGSVWLQKTVNIPSSWCDQEVELRLGTLMDGDTTYVNGTNVGGFGFKYPPRRYFLAPGILHEGENTITIRLVVDTNIGGAVKECPYYLKLKDQTIDLSGTWDMRFGYSSEPLEGQTFFIWSPTALFNSMLYPIGGLSCKAILFYQGESNCEYPQYYAPLLIDMVKEWRTLFGKKTPFYMAEVTYWLGDGPVYEEDPFDGVRKVQHEVESQIPSCYLIPTYDLGFYNDLHPQNKKEVALRFFEKYIENEK
ncbi:MAG: hypothetical protein J6U23_12485 [Clostridiales bacterium]|nr:hypothetical protein [Clostridiales bacterium]MBP5417600.1 hypothetical protein [Clostridiales bacterium]